MKLHSVRSLAFALAFAMLFLLLASCGKKEKDPPATTADTVCFLKNGASDYTIIYGDSSNDRNKGAGVAAYSLSAAIKETTGVEIPVESNIAGDESATGGKEILIGLTDRVQSAEQLGNLRVNDYVIAVTGEKLVIGGGSAEKTAEAVKKFIQLYFSQPQTNLILASDYRYEKKADYALSSLTLCGKELSEFSVIYAAGNEASANRLAAGLESLYGYTLPVSPDSVTETECEILVGNTKRSQSTQNTENGYQIRQDGSKLVISGSDVGSVGSGVYAFLSYLEASGDSLTLDGCSQSGAFDASATVRIMDLNLTLSGYADNSVVNRYPRLYELVSTYSPSILCLQELSGTTWYDCITEGIGDTPALTDRYAFVGTPRNGDEPQYTAGLTGAYDAILYDPSVYRLEDSGTFWLSETPTVPSVGWDGRTRAICTWAKLTDLQSGKTFAVMNTQLDSYGSKSPLNGMNLICERAEDFDCPVILCGDLVSGDTGKPYQAAISAGFLDSASAALIAEEVGSTVNNYGSSNASAKATDFIFATLGNTRVEHYRVIRDLIDGGYVSSHWAILAEIGI
ncbi:MAG: hypothetical protein ACI3XR_06320 [Eubacteriales bacterium]